MKPAAAVPRARRAFKIILLGILLVGSAVQLHVGLADSGDYSRLMVWMTSAPSGFVENWPAEGTQAHEERFFKHLPMFWKLDFPMTGRWLSSILLVWLPGLFLNLLLYSHDTLYLPFISVTPRLVVLLFVWLFLRWVDREAETAAPVLYLVPGIPLVLIGFNTDYIAYFTSLFQEPASLIGLLLILIASAYYRGKGHSRARPWLSMLAVFFMTTAKLSNVHWALVGALLLLPWESLRQRPRRVISYALFIVALPVGFSLLQATLYHSRIVNAYQSIYCGALVFSDRPQEHLDRLSMGDGAKYIGYHAFCDEGIEAMERYRPKMNHRVALDIIAHEPGIAWDMLVFAADSMQRSQLTHLSKRVLYNDPGTSRPWSAWLPATAATATPLSVWTTLKRNIFPRGYALIIVLVLLALLPLPLWNARHRLLSTFARVTVVLALATLAELWMQVFGDGQRDLLKHLYLANICFDASLLSFVGALLLLAFSPKARQRLRG
ncbi:MAG: hypothetical protein C0600_15130 [Ignavibacteria bacterium]|nr:MAG: hypothetical protein C0600_15130 [Ignavibacteria bacterium]